MAEDAAAETMAAVWDKWDILLTYDRPDYWTFKFAIRKLRLMKMRELEREMVTEDAIEKARVAAADPEIQADASSDIEGELIRLPRRQQQVLALAMDGHQPAEIARILGITPNAVPVHLHHARSSVRSAAGSGFPRGN